MSTLRRCRFLAAVVLAVCMASCLPFTQKQGRYEFLPVEVLRDDCGLLDANRDQFFGTLQITGRVVRMDFGLLDTQLIGYFLEQGEEFTMDGSVVNAAATVRGQDCLLENAEVHVDGSTRCATQFDGELRVRYRADRAPTCACELWMRYEAVQNGERCSE